jgi:hypothetical protein
MMPRTDPEPLPTAPPIPTEEPLPLPVVPDWDERLREADRLARLIDRHLDHEERQRLMRGQQLTPLDLCLEQRANMVTDLLATILRA